MVNHKRPSHILMVFVDGVGLGPSGPQNPFAARTYQSWEFLTAGQGLLGDLEPVREERLTAVPLDACLGIEGLPQSGTGQATLFTGRNCAEAAGRHFGPYPPVATRPLIAEYNVFSRISGARPGGKLCFANGYPDRFFTYVRERDRWTVTTRCCLDAGVQVLDQTALLSGRALPADITGEGLKRLGLNVPVRTPEEAAAQLMNLTGEHLFTLFEFYLTDKAGHSRDAEKAQSVLATLDRFLCALIERITPEDTLLLLSSDHGNLEDLSVKTHTFNPVPLLAYGCGAAAFASARSLMDVAPLIQELVSL